MASKQDERVSLSSSEIVKMSDETPHFEGKFLRKEQKGEHPPRKKGEQPTPRYVAFFECKDGTEKGVWWCAALNKLERFTLAEIQPYVWLSYKGEKELDKGGTYHDVEVEVDKASYTALQKYLADNPL